MIGNYGTMVSYTAMRIGSCDARTYQNAGRQYQRFREVCEQNTECLRADRDRPSVVSLPIVWKKSNSNNTTTQICPHGVCRRHHRRGRFRSVRRGDLGPSDYPWPLDRKQWCQSWCCVLWPVFHSGTAWVEYLCQLHLGGERSECYVSSGT